MQKILQDVCMFLNTWIDLGTLIIWNPKGSNVYRTSDLIQTYDTERSEQNDV